MVYDEEYKTELHAEDDVLREPRALLDSPQGVPDRTISSGNPGRELRIPAAGKNTIAELRGNDPLAQPISISLTSPDSGALGPTVNPAAEIEWGTGGTQSTALVDFINGMTLTVSGSWVRVNAVNVADAGGPSVKLGATLAYGYRPCVIPPTRTLFLDTALAVAATAAFPVAAFAGRVTFFRQPETSAAELEFIDPAAVVLYTIPIAAGTTPLDPILIANTVRTILVRNTGAVAIAKIRLIFELFL